MDDAKQPEGQSEYPPLPSRIGKVTKRVFIDGSPMEYTVVDEITRMPASTPGKAIYLQLLRFANGREELRLCYYMIAHKPRAKGNGLTVNSPR